MASLFETGFAVRQPSWHRQETLVQESPRTWAEARQLGGFEWEPAFAPVYEPVGMSECGHPHMEPVDGYQRVIRDDTGKTLAITRDTYPLITHAEMGEVMEEILKTANITYETGGVLDEGKRVWALAVLDEPVTIPGDTSQTLPYLSVTNRHDANGAFTVQATAVRIVCANTWHAAEVEGERTGTVYSFHHTKNWRNKVEEARAAVTAARDSISRYYEVAEALIKVRVTTKQRELFVCEFFPMPPVGMASDRTIGNVEASRTALRTILGSKTTADVAHTAYGLVQGAGEYLDHARRSKSWETKLNRTMLTPESLKGRAVKLAQLVAKG